MKRSGPTASSTATSASQTALAGWPHRAVFALLLLAAFAVYLPSLGGALLWDDAGHVTAPALQSLSGLARIWFEPGATQQYYPLLHSAFWLEHRLWGDATLGYHLINVLWHALSATLFVALLRRLAVPGALLAGLLFALHPVCVESVAWISEQKNTLSAVFYLAAALAWLRFEEDRRPRAYVVATLWFLAAVLTKTVTATLPAALLVVAWWRQRLSWRATVRPLLPWFAIGIGAGLFTAWVERTGIGAQGADFNLSLVERGLLAGRIFWFYLGKLLWPADLMFFYPRWQIEGAALWQYAFPLAALALLGAVLWQVWRGRGRGALAAFLLFGGTLFPALGFFNVYPFVFSYVADHFQYLANLSLLALLAAAATRAPAQLRWPTWSVPAATTTVLALFAVLTWQQSRTYRDVFSLYEATLARNPASWVAQLNLGTALDDAGRTEEALPHLQRALELKPDFPEALNSIGNVLNQLGRPTEARPLLERAVQLQPRFATAHNTLGVVLMSLGEADAGVAAFQRALAIDPAFALARVNLGWALANRGQFDAAVAQFAEACRLQPDLADAEFKWGLAGVMQRRFTEAVAHLRRAVELQPANPAMRYLLGGALLETGQPAAAADQFEATLQLAPDHAGARAALDHLRATAR